MKLAASQELKEGLETKHVNDGLLGYLVSRFSLDSLSRKLNRNPVLEQDNILRVKQISSSSLRTKISIDVAEPRND